MHTNDPLCLVWELLLEMSGSFYWKCLGSLKLILEAGVSAGQGGGGGKCCLGCGWLTA